MSLKLCASVIVLGLACVSAPALAAPAVLPEATAAVQAEQPLHSLDELAARAIASANTVATPAASPAAGSMATAADRTATERPASVSQTTAADAARDSAATAATCSTYFAQSVALGPTLGTAFKALQARDLATLGTLLPGLQAQLNGVIASEVKPEVCDGNHINAYTEYQYFELSVLRARGIDTGLPAGLPLVKQPALNQPGLPYVVGWTLYEQKDFEGALAAYSKGLTMFPHDHALQNEYAATLLQLNRGAQTVSYVDSVLNGTYDLSDADRSKFFAGRGVGLILLGRLDEAETSFNVAQRYQYNESTKQFLDQLKAAKAQK